MNTKSLLIAAILLATLSSDQCVAQSCVHLQAPLWIYPNGIVAYSAFRSEGICGEGCPTETPVFHVDDPFFLTEIPHDCEVGEGLQQTLHRRLTNRFFVSHTSDDEPNGNPLCLASPVSANYDFFTTWNAEHAPELMRPGGAIRQCTHCLSGRNYTLVSPDGNETIAIRVFKIKVIREGQQPEYCHMAYERQPGPSEGNLLASHLVKQKGTAGGYRFWLPPSKDNPYSGAGWILLLRTGNNDTEA